MEQDNLLGEKIKKLRIEKKLTQKDVAGDGMTRNMLSQIENGLANPSLSSLRYIAKKLDVPVAYLVSENDSIFLYEKNESIQTVHKAFADKNYQSCIFYINKISGTDYELSYILSVCYFELGKKAIMLGELNTASKNFSLSYEHAKKTIYNTANIESLIPLYSAVAKNIQSPLLEFNKEEYEAGLYSSLDYEFYKYLTLDYSYNYKNESYKLHADAKILMKERKYGEALPMLLKASELTKSGGYNAFLIFGVYTDLEQCYKALYDFENAYLYASKRLSLIEGFKS